MRTLTLRAALLVTTYAVVLVSARSGDRDSSVAVATHQLAFTIWTFLAFILDAVAIAAQAITGRYLGAGDVPATREVTRRMIQWGLVGGAVLGIATIAVAPIVGRLFTEDPEVRALLVPVLVVVGLSQPLCGLVFVLDGILIGAGDGTYLAKAGTLVLAVYAPVVLAVASVAGGLVWIWLTFTIVLMGARAVVLVRRERGDAWLVTGVVRSGRP